MPTFGDKFNLKGESPKAGVQKVGVRMKNIFHTVGNDPHRGHIERLEEHSGAGEGKRKQNITLVVCWDSWCRAIPALTY